MVMPSITIEQGVSDNPTISEMESPICVESTIIPCSNSDDLHHFAMNSLASVHTNSLDVRAQLR